MSGNRGRGETGIARLSLAAGREKARALLDRAPFGAVEIPRPAFEDLSYRDFVHALLRGPGFKLDFNRRAPDAALAMVSDRVFGPGTFVRERAALAEEIDALAGFARGLIADATCSIAIRTYFAPGDLVWHVDRLHARTAFRLLWPIGRPAGMRVAAPAAIDASIHRAYMHREHPLLCQLDSRVLRSGAAMETLWAHRPVQLAGMTSGDFPFVRDAAQVRAITPGAASIHRVESATQAGTYHRSSLANRASPGLQIVITVAAETE